MTGRKDDAGKPRWSLIPWRALSVVVQVLEHGAARYGAENWRQVPEGRTRYADALERHLVAWRLGEKCDAPSAEGGSGLPHLAHVVCCGLFLLALEGDGGAEKKKEGHPPFSMPRCKSGCSRFRSPGDDYCVECCKKMNKFLKANKESY